MLGYANGCVFQAVAQGCEIDTAVIEDGVAYGGCGSYLAFGFEDVNFLDWDIENRGVGTFDDLGVSH